MEAIRQQVTALSHKVDSLYKIIEQLNDKLTDSISEPKLTASRNREIGIRVSRENVLSQLQ